MIIFFSGTGNSAYAAMRLSEAMSDRELIDLRGPALLDPEPINPSNGRIVWLFPVYSWGVPPVVRDYIRKVTVEDSGTVTHHLVVTYGDDIGYTDRQWERLIHKRGWTTGSKWSVRMPNTYTLMKGFDVDSPEVEHSKLAAAPSRLREIAEGIINGSAATDVERGRWARIKSGVIYPWFSHYAMNAKPFHPSERCIGCGICARECPTGNIAMDDDRKPQWSDNCAMCLRCYHICPRHAVEYGKATRDKGQYICPCVPEFNKNAISR